MKFMTSDHKFATANSHIMSFKGEIKIAPERKKRKKITLEFFQLLQKKERKKLNLKGSKRGPVG